MSIGKIWRATVWFRSTRSRGPMRVDNRFHRRKDAKAWAVRVLLSRADATRCNVGYTLIKMRSRA